MTTIYNITEVDEGQEIAAFLKKHGYSRSITTSLKHGDRLLLNGEKARTVDILHNSDILSVTIEDETDIVPNSSLSVPICYEDEDIVVFDKPYDMAVHPSLRHYDDTLANFFAFRYPDITFRSISRLDRNTSGLVVVAKNKLAASILSGNPKMRPKKLYYAVVEGDVSEEYGCCGEIIAPIARENNSIITRVVSPDGKHAHTVFKTIKCSDKMSFLEVSLVTGRTHQIRVHFSHIGHPLMGDDLYGGSRELINRHALHCGEISFIHPITKEKTIVTSDIPEDMKRLVENI